MSGRSDAGASAAADSGVLGSCMFDNSPDDTGCTSDELEAYSQCVQKACKTKFEDCYGKDYLKGSFSGPCADYLTCEDKCGCSDTSCMEACTPNASCTSCQQGFSSCAISCIDKLDCATRGLDDAGFALPDGGSLFGDKTCADLLTCCNGLSDADKKSECMTIHDQFASNANGDLICSTTIGQYCP